MIDLFNIFVNLLLSLILGLLTVKILKFKCCPYKVGLLTVIYFIILYHFIFTDECVNSKTFFIETFGNLNNNKKSNIYSPQLDVVKDTFIKSEDNYYGTKMPIMGPLDGLPWEEVIRRVNYIKYKTQYPYKPMTYTDYKTSMDDLLGNDLSGLLKYSNINTKENKLELARWYPDLTLNQINARDCTNYNSDHPLSCIQGKYNDDLLLEDDKDKKKELFESSDIYKSTNKLLENDNTIPTLFKNSERTINLDNDNNKDMSKDLCRGCTTGICIKDVCGSRIIEKGNNNLLSLDGYIKSYLEDNINPLDIKESKPVNPWTFF